MSLAAEVAQMIQFYPNLAIQYHPEEFVADRVLSKALVQNYAGSFTKFSPDTAFASYPDIVSPNGDVPEITFKTTLDQYFAEPYGNRTFIDYDAIARNPVQVSWPELKVAFLARNVKLQKELRTITLAKAATTYKTATDAGFSGKAWSDAAAKPIYDVQVLREKFAMPPNTIVMDYPTFVILQNHPNVLGQRPVLRAGSVNPAELAALFGVDNLIVSELKYNTSGNKNRAQSLGYAWSGVFFMCYREPDENMTTDTITWATQFLVNNDEIPGPRVSQAMTAAAEGWVIRAWETPERGVAGSMAIQAVHKYDLHVQAADLGFVLDTVSTS